MLSVACYKDIKLRPCSHVLDSSCSSTKTLPDRASIPDFRNRAKLCCATPPHANFECVAWYIGYVLCHILVHREQVFEPYGQGKWMSGSRDWNPQRWKKIFRREDWNLVYQILSANCSSIMFPGHCCSYHAGSSFSCQHKKLSSISYND